MPAFPSTSATHISVIGHGFLGKSIVDELASQGLPISVLCRAPPKCQAVQGVSYCVGPVADQARLRPETSGGLVVFAAGGTSPALSRCELSKLATEELELLDIAIRTSADRAEGFVYLSSSAVYGEVISHAAREGDPLNPVSGYGHHKIMCEEKCKALAAELGVGLTILRLSNPFGAHQISGRRQGLIGILLDNIRTNQLTSVRGDGAAVRDYFPSSVLGSVIGLMAKGERGAPEILNVSSGVGLTTIQVIRKLESWLGKNISFRFIPSVDGEIHRSVLDPSLLQEWAGISQLETSFESGLKALECIMSRLDA